MPPRKRAEPSPADPVTVEDETTGEAERPEPASAGPIPAVAAVTRPAPRGDRRQRYREV